MGRERAEPNSSQSGEPEGQETSFREFSRKPETWRKSQLLKALLLTVPRGDYGEFGLEEFPAGTYPSCSKHGAMNRVSSDRDWWRCIACNIGCEWHREVK